MKLDAKVKNKKKIEKKKYKKEQLQGRWQNRRKRKIIYARTRFNIEKNKIKLENKS